MEKTKLDKDLVRILDELNDASWKASSGGQDIRSRILDLEALLRQLPACCEGSIGNLIERFEEQKRIIKNLHGGQEPSGTALFNLDFKLGVTKQALLEANKQLEESKDRYKVLLNDRDNIKAYLKCREDALTVSRERLTKAEKERDEAVHQKLQLDEKLNNLTEKLDKVERENHELRERLDKVHKLTS